MSKKTKQPEINKVFRERRSELGISQRDTASASGITEAAYVRIEQGASSPKWKTITAISDVLKIEWRAFPVKEK